MSGGNMLSIVSWKYIIPLLQTTDLSGVSCGPDTLPLDSVGVLYVVLKESDLYLVKKWL